MSSTTFIKLSLLFQYLRVYQDWVSMRRFCILLIGLIAFWGSAFSFVAWVPCFPVHQYWDLTDTGRRCYGFGVSTDRITFIIHTSANMTFDLLVLAIPIPLYFEKTTMSRTRTGMIVLLFLGCL